MQDEASNTAVAAEETQEWNSRFGYIMVAAGAAIGLGNVWKFPYLTYHNGGGAFILSFVILAAILAYPMLKIESSVGRHGRGDTVTAFEKINSKWGFIGWVATICTMGINFFYVVVGGWVLKYAVHYIVNGNFGEAGNTEAFFTNFTTSAVEPIIWTLILLAFTSILLMFGITNFVEKIVKVIMPVLAVFLIICGLWALFTIDGAMKGLSFYFVPDFSHYTFKTFAQAATQVLFSVGIGWGIFTTLGANLSKSTNIKQDSAMIITCDASIAIIAGFVVIPSALAFGTDVEAGPRLIFEVMTGVFASLPGGRILGIFFFVALLFAVLSSLFTFFEIPMRVFEQKLGMGRKKGVLIVSLIIFIGNIIVSLGFGPLSGVTIPWPYATGIEQYGFYDWLDCFTAYLLLPAGVILEAIFVAKVWGFEKYNKEMTNDGELSPIKPIEKFIVMVVNPILMIIVFLNVFGFIQ